MGSTENQTHQIAPKSTIGSRGSGKGTLENRSL
jgi:hypothetical protein